MHWIDGRFRSGSDELLRKSILPKLQGDRPEVNFETVNANDLQPRITSAIQSGAGPDIVMLNNNHPQLYAGAAPMSANSRGGRQGAGRYYKLARPTPTMARNYLGALVGDRRADRLPQVLVREVGYNKFPETGAVPGRRRQEAQGQGRPIGQTLGHTFGDSPTSATRSCGPHGGKEVDEKGKVVLDSKESSSPCAHDRVLEDETQRGGSPWDDTNNNRAFLSQTICATLNGASIYIESLRKPDQYKTEKGAQLKTDILHAPLPKGPAGQFAMHTFHSHVIPAYSKNQKAAKQFLTWMHTPANYEKWFVSQKGSNAPRGMGEAQDVGEDRDAPYRSPEVA